MTASRYQGYAQDNNGTIIPDAVVTIRDQDTNTIVNPIWSNRAGTSTKSNPFNADSNGYFFFYAPAGRYRVVVGDGTNVASFQDVQLGTASERDTGTSAGQIPLIDDLATVAESGSFNDLDDVPAFGTASLVDMGTAGGEIRTNTQNDERFLKQDSNLSDLESVPTAVANLGLSGALDQDDKNQLSLSLNTGIISGGEISINSGDSEKFDVAAGSGIIVDHSTFPPTVNVVTWDAFVGVEVDDLATAASTDIAIDADSQIAQQRRFTNDENRDVIFLGGLAHEDNIEISRVFNVRIPSYAPGLSVRDLARAIGDINRAGNVFGPEGTGLQIEKSIGAAFRFGANELNDPKDPHTIEQPALDPVTFTYARTDGSGGTTFTPGQTNINPGQKDDGNGSLVSVSTNRWSVQRISVFADSNAVFVQYGVLDFNQRADAIQAIAPGLFPSLPGITGAMIRAYLVVRGGATNLSSSSDALFVEADKFGSIGGGLTGDDTLGTAAFADVTTSTSDDTADRVILTQHGAMLGRENTFTADQTVDGSISATGNAQFGRQTEGIVTMTDNVINCAEGNYFKRTIDGAAEFSFSNVPSSVAFAVTLELNHESGAITWPAAVRWPNDDEPTPTTGNVHLFVFVTSNGGTTWFGAALLDYEV